MSEKPNHGAKHDDAHHGATTVRASKGGGIGKAVAVGAAAVVLLGGGYLAWKNYPTNQNSADIAYNEYADDPLRAGPLPADENADVTADAASADDVAAPPAVARSSTPARRSTARAEQAVPEATIGLTPASLTTENNDDIVVRAPQRPVWSSTPTARRISAFYPERALERGREGEARLHCVVQERGVMDCQPVSETPARAGFGNAAVRVARTFRHAPMRADGSDAIGTPVNLRVVFRMDEDSRRRG